MNKAKEAASLYLSLSTIEARAAKMEEKLNKALDEMTEQERQDYIKLTEQIDAKFTNKK